MTETTEEKINGTWPRNKDHQEALRRTLYVEAKVNGDTFGGAAGLAKVLATGKKVRTTKAAAGIWTGGSGNFIKIEHDPEGVGTILMWVDPSIWQSGHLEGYLERRRDADEELLEEAEKKVATIREKYLTMKGAAAYVANRKKRHEKANPVQPAAPKRQSVKD